MIILEELPYVCHMSSYKWMVMVLSLFRDFHCKVPRSPVIGIPEMSNLESPKSLMPLPFLDFDEPLLSSCVSLTHAHLLPDLTMVSDL